ncbi:hypothetical protein AZH53_05280 [Methanomicrobiaceae archaeon CYW5]|nr:hypothetical protein [Methanovulcanius yangii]
METLQKKETQDIYVEQAWSRLDEVKVMEKDVKERMKTAPDLIKEDLAACAVDIDMFINLAEVEIDMVEHADVNEWIGMRNRVDNAIGEAQRELERAHEIMSNPYAYLRSPDNFPRKGID